MTDVNDICVVVSRMWGKCRFGGSCAQRRTIARVGTGIPGPCMIRQPNLRGLIFGQFLFGFWSVPERMCSWGSRLFVGSLVFSGRRLPIPNTCCLVPRSHLSLANLAQGAPRPSSHTINNCGIQGYALPQIHTDLVRVWSCLACGVCVPSLAFVAQRRALAYSKRRQSRTMHYSQALPSKLQWQTLGKEGKHETIYCCGFLGSALPHINGYEPFAR